MSIPIQPFQFPDLKTNHQLFIKREDLIHPIISGNKFWKMKYNLLRAKDLNCKTLITFGGAMSNHIVATAGAGKENNFKTIGIIRGEEIENCWKDNLTLQEAHQLGMEFYFVPRSEYRLKEHSTQIQNFLQTIPNHYLVPEGGTNELAVLGASEILSKETEIFDIITIAVGTGGTISGLLKGSYSHQHILGFPALKNAEFLRSEILKLTEKTNFDLILDYHFGGYAKVKTNLIQFINDFFQLNKILLDPIYTGKMMYGLYEMLKNGLISDKKKILAIHTGGLQGIHEMNKILMKNEKPLILTKL
ncbi:1-aminocyclopropane-1-carboxylate deaminase/D-cysteine desulfhydrase [Apibacter muscae]|uniref:1-aminocyclopropane-1-carboxylate deaminase/D-cysteine desulfhydrase n=1 Tax=Apibacter muscae TaxID=2509004 RepID=A0A563DK17_9FLAO|nr:pyridoxal-phosphate dependent enzyme [Apibacter muscae]TWP30497.1 1-aminocyclopropane-1-carboxylate deaminase/D-cysteine desulfhydrase [Apibacter muscae]